MRRASAAKPAPTFSVWRMSSRTLRMTSASRAFGAGAVAERKECTYSYFGDPMYVFMDADYNQYEIEAESMGDALNYLEEAMPVEVVFYDGRAISVELPTILVREITYTEPAVRGDTSGKVLKPAKINTGFELQVPLFCAIGDKIEIDTRTNEYRSRVN
jgi:elongation factor P